MSLAEAPVQTEPERFEQVCRILDRFQRDPARLIPILREVQEIYHHLPEPVMTYVATSLGLPPARVYGVATFYAHFALTPKGKHVIRMCNGTACNVKGSVPVLEAIYKRLGLSDEKTTTDDGLFTVETVSCLGACGLSPVMTVDEQVHGQMTPKEAVRVVEDVMAKEGVA